MRFVERFHVGCERKGWVVKDDTKVFGLSKQRPVMLCARMGKMAGGWLLEVLLFGCDKLEVPLRSLSEGVSENRGQRIEP